MNLTITKIISPKTHERTNRERNVDLSSFPYSPLGISIDIPQLTRRLKTIPTKRIASTSLIFIQIKNIKDILNVKA
jgi:hypothetical protein